MSQYMMSAGQRYRCKITLGGFESWASNERVQQELETIGFTDVVVTGEGAVRAAEGTWSGADIAVEVPAQISNIEEIVEQDSDEEE